MNALQAVDGCTDQSTSGIANNSFAMGCGAVLSDLMPYLKHHYQDHDNHQHEADTMFNDVDPDASIAAKV